MPRHDRPIHTRVDDSVVRVVRGRPVPVRRSRGYAPEPLSVPWPAHRPVLACGAELKSTFCLLRDRHAVLSHHIGDLENWETYRSYTEGIEHYRRLLDVDPVLVAHDLHPDYLSTAYALELAGVELIGVQHHHAHVASCLADNGVAGPVIGLALDGTGFGPDGTLWGGEVLVADLLGFRRVGHLAPGAAARWGGGDPGAVADGGGVPGGGGGVGAAGAAAARRALGGGAVGRRRCASARPVPGGCSTRSRRWPAYGTGSATRARPRSSWSSGWTRRRPARTRPGSRAACCTGSTWSARPPPTCSPGSPSGPSRPASTGAWPVALVALVERARVESGLSTVALSGGVLQNVVLLTLLTDELTARGCTVLTHSRVPPNDAGISLGQAVVAAARDRS